MLDSSNVKVHNQKNLLKIFYVKRKKKYKSKRTCKKKYNYKVKLKKTKF